MTFLSIRNPQQLTIRSNLDLLQLSLQHEIDEGRVEQTITDCKKDNSQAKHYFGKGVYARSLLIPAGSVVVGHIHKQDRICIIAQGDCTFVDEWGKKRVQAPYIGEFKAGSKTAVYAHKDTLWIACLGTDYKNADDIVVNLLDTTHEDYQLYLEKLED